MTLRFNKARLSKKARFLLIPSGFVVIELSSNKRLWVTGNTGKNGGAEGILWPHSQRHQLVHQDFLWCWKWTILPNAGSSGLWKVHLRSVLYAATGEDTLGSEKVLFFFFLRTRPKSIWRTLGWSLLIISLRWSSPVQPRGWGQRAALCREAALARKERCTWMSIVSQVLLTYMESAV